MPVLSLLGGSSARAFGHSTFTPAGAGLNVEEVFSTYLYGGTNTTNAINNGIDLDGESGIVWIKNRDQTDNHYIFGGESNNNWTKILTPNSTGYYGGGTGVFDGVSSTGFTVKSDFGGVNTSGENYVSWTFRKAPKFFDVVTYTGTGSNQTISHNLGCEVGAIFVKRTDAAANWAIQHRSTTNTDGLLYLNLTNAEASGFGTVWNGRATSTDFTVGTSTAANTSGASYVAYLFAHNDGDGGFGPNADQDIIKCGSYTGNGSSNGPEIDLGFEPQWLLLKHTTSSGNYWHMYDAMRGWLPDAAEATLLANTNNGENGLTGATNYSTPTATGFKIESASGEVNTSGSNYVYIAIRRGPMAVPESATDVFHVATGGDVDTSAPHFRSGFPVDMATFRILNQTYDTWLSARLIEDHYFKTNTNNANFGSTIAKFDYQDGWFNYTGTNSQWISHMWRRAPNFFDVVYRDGTNNTSDTITHNLSAVPELIITKRRNTNNEWYVAHEFGSTSFKRSYLEQTAAASSHNYTSGFFHVGQPTDTEYYLNGNNANYNQSGSSYVDFLFCSLDGVSKVGTYTGNGGSSGGNGSSQNIDCGFSAGASFVLIKRTDSTGDWYVFDSERGIVSGNDPYIKLNSSNSEQSLDTIDPYNSGFTINQQGLTNLNVTNATYLFYAIAAI